jgi:hypothetical protein
MTTALNPLEQIFADGFIGLVGDPVFLGLMIIGFFGAMVFVQGTRLDGKLAVFVPAFILSMVFVPFLAVFFALGISTILYFAFTKFTNK